LRRIRAECCSIAYASDADKDKFAGLPIGARGAVQIADGNTASYFLTTFGRASRETVLLRSEMEPKSRPSAHLMERGKRACEGQGRRCRKALAREKKTPPQVITNVPAQRQSRPTEDEHKAIGNAARRCERPGPPLEDVFLALLNSREFLFNIDDDEIAQLYRDRSPQRLARSVALYARLRSGLRGVRTTCWWRALPAKDAVSLDPTTTSHRDSSSAIAFVA